MSGSQSLHELEEKRMSGCLSYYVSCLLTAFPFVALDHARPNSYVFAILFTELRRVLLLTSSCKAQEIERVKLDSIKAVLGAHFHIRLRLSK